MNGRLIGIAVRPARYAALEEHNEIEIREDGLAGDHVRDRKGGARFNRIVSILAAEDWAAACAGLDPPADPKIELSWLTRRANLLLEGVRLPRAQGAILKIGGVELEVRKQTYPCKRMEDARPGLLKALAKEWRGGVLCRVLTPGTVRIADDVVIVSSPPGIDRRLP
ncbi:MAG: MOSC domain-containing protein [Marinicaulis sp.]|nr:hypothetical protein [Marinicaulis sp.]NNL89778.1 MOSC domain-containing protein [Marinicaulis sp.]